MPSRFMSDHGMVGLVALGAVFLAVTGAEALYADLGHFGRRPIQAAWLVLVLPGAGAELSRPGRAGPGRSRRRSRTRSSCCVPEWALLPMVLLATVATIIASQAVITGAFSLTQQAIQLGLLPRMEIRHTSEAQPGQIYMPAGQLAAADRRAAAGRPVRLVQRAGHRLWHRRHRHDGGDGAAGLHRGLRKVLELAGLGGGRG